MSAEVIYQTTTAFNRFYSWCVRPEVRKHFIILIIINFANYLSVIRANYLYRDDIIKTVLNNEGWEQEGRLLSYLFSKILFFGTNADASPFTQITAILIISASSLVVGYGFCRHKPILISYLAPICIFPYVLENISYKFYALWMSIAILVSIIPVIFLFIDHTLTKTIVTFICTLMCLNIYQVATGIFIILFCQKILQDIRTTEPISIIIKKNVSSIIGFFLAFTAYYFEVKFISPVTSQWGSSHSETIFFTSNWTQTLANNIENYFQYIYEDWVETPFWFIIIVNTYIITAISLRNIFKAQNIIQSVQKSFLYILATMTIIIAPHFPQLILTRPVLQPRTFLSFGVLTSIMLVDATLLLYKYNKYKIILLAINTYLICNFLIIGNIYGNLLSAQDTWENNILPILTNDLQKVKEDKKCHDIFISDDIGYSPAFRNISNNYRVLRKLIEPRLGNDYFPEYYLRYYGLHFRKHIKAYYGPYQTIISSPRYDIGVLPDNTCFISFKKIDPL